MSNIADGKPDGRMISDGDSNLTGLLRNFESRLKKSISAFDKRLMNSRKVMREINASVKPMAESSQKRLEKRIDEFDKKITALANEVEKLKRPQPFPVLPEGFRFELCACKSGEPVLVHAYTPYDDYRPLTHEGKW